MAERKCPTLAVFVQRGPAGEEGYSGYSAARRRVRWGSQRRGCYDGGLAWVKVVVGDAGGEPKHRPTTGPVAHGQRYAVSRLYLAACPGMRHESWTSDSDPPSPPAACLVIFC